MSRERTGWMLSDDETSDLMDAVATVLNPWMRDLPTTVTWEDEDGTTRPMRLTVRGVGPEASEGIRRLHAVYESIIEKGAVAGSPEEIARHVTEAKAP